MITWDDILDAGLYLFGAISIGFFCWVIYINAKEMVELYNSFK